MSDFADLAQCEESIDRDAAISAALLRPKGCESGPYWDSGTAYCRNCEEMIPEKRLLAVPGTGLCVVCASEAQEDTRYLFSSGQEPALA